MLSLYIPQPKGLTRTYRIPKDLRAEGKSAYANCIYGLCWDKDERKETWKGSANEQWGCGNCCAAFARIFWPFSGFLSLKTGENDRKGVKFYVPSTSLRQGIAPSVRKNLPMTAKSA